MTAAHWDEAYLRGDTTRSWFQRQPLPSLRALAAAGATPQDSIIDIGGGASPLVDALLDRDQKDVAVLDVSAEGLRTAQRRLGASAERVTWIVTELLTWRPPRTWKFWHDRAVLHFFTDAGERARYVQVLDAATESGSVAVIATFAPDGPEQCSGLPVSRYDAEDLAALLGDQWELTSTSREQHTTPSGGTQPFTWATFCRQR